MADRWHAAGLHRLVSRLVSFDVVPGGVRTVAWISPAGRDDGVLLECTWTGDAQRVRLDVSLTPHGWQGLDWGRVGFGFTVPGELEDVEWFGRGPGQGYPDTGQGARLGWHRGTVQTMQVPYVRPQESGARRDVCALRLSGASGSGLQVTGEPFAVTVRPWSTEALAAATHREDLIPDGRTHVVLDHRQQGVGSAACGPGVLPRYALRPAPAEFRLWFSPEGGTQQPRR